MDKKQIVKIGIKIGVALAGAAIALVNNKMANDEMKAAVEKSVEKRLSDRAKESI